MSAESASDRVRAGLLAALVILALYGGLAVSVDFPKAAIDIQSDEATYLAMGYSLAYDWDLEYRKTDLDRFFAEWPNGPGGIFLKRGTDVTGLALSTNLFAGRPDADTTRLYFGKSFAYPLFAAPFVRVFGTNGFLVLNALLLVAAFLAAYFFISARSSISISLLLASAFIFASVMPVYFVWTTPELFNFSLAAIAYFLWLYKFVAPPAASFATSWLREPASDWMALAILGLLTFSKVTNALLVLPPVAWLLWQREWRRAIVASAIAGVVTVAMFGANVVSSGEWNYQGGPGEDRVTCSERNYPFLDPAAIDTWQVCKPRQRQDALTNEIFDRQVFWSNLRANLGYFFVGRYGGLLAYFFPAVFALAAFGMARGRRESWQWLVLGGVGLSIVAFIISVPYTYLGGGGSVGNRYFTAVYGLCVFLLPPIRSTAAALLPWIVGGFFMGKLILNPFQTSIRPFEPAKTGALRLFPVELTNTNDLPYMNEGHRVMVWYGDPSKPPRFQIYHYDDNAYLREADGVSFSVRGRARAEMLIKANPFVNEPDEPLNVQPPKMLKMTLTAGRVPTTVTVALKGGDRQEHRLQPDQQWTVWLTLPKPFPFNLVQDKPRAMPASLWVLSISSSDGFSPRMYDPSSPDLRFLGVRVTPDLIR